MKLRKNGETMTISQNMGCFWLFGSFFVVIGLMFVYGASGGYSNFAEASWILLLAHFCFGVVGVAAGLWFISTHPAISVTIDKNEQLVTLLTRGVFRRSERTFEFGQIRKFEVVEDIDSDGDTVWMLELVTISGESIPISSVPSPAESSKRGPAFEANAFLGRKPPLYLSDTE
ncbi:MAG: hypothetical protein KF762_13125 [Acidobacteria bacterium]|nr:hypothetical protein [Acidobacteriota bacterium]